MKLNGQLIAVLDDEEYVRRALDRLLRAAGFAVESFGNAVDLVASLRGHLPACLVLDLHMPGMDGMEVLATMAKSDWEVPVVVVTGHDTPDARQRALDGGAAAYLCKPVDGRQLLTTLRTLLRTQGDGEV